MPNLNLPFKFPGDLPGILSGFFSKYGKETGIFVGGLVLGFGTCYIAVKSHEPDQNVAPPGGRTEYIDPLLKKKAKLVPAYRYLESGVWKVRLGELSEGENKGAELLGLLYKDPMPPEVDVPVFICNFREVATNTAFEGASNCGGDGTIDPQKPVGYTSKLIRSGFSLLARCKSPKQGMYNTKKTSCDDPADHLQSIFGAIRVHPEI